MSIDKSLRRKNTLARSRNVLTRAERILKLMDDGKWPDGRAPYGLPKVRVLKVAAPKKVKKEKTEETAAAGGEKAPAAAGTAAPEAKPAAKK